MSQRKPDLKNSLLLVITLLFFVFYLVCHSLQKKLIDNDSCLWINYGLQLFQGNLESFRFIADAPPYSPLVYAPGYPFLIGLVHLLFRNPVVSAHLVSMIAGALLLLVVFRLATELFDETIGLIALLLCGVYTQLVTYALSALQPSTVTLFLALSAYFFMLSLKRKGGTYPLLAGLTAGIAVLTRFELALYAILFAGLYAWRILRKKGRFKSLVLYGISVALVYALYAVPLYLNSGFKVISPYIGEKILSSDIPDKPNINYENYLKLDLSARALLFNKNTASSISLSKQNRVRASPEDWGKQGHEKDRNPSQNQGIARNYNIFLKSLFPKLFRFYLVPFLLFGAAFCYRQKNSSSWILFSLIFVTLVFFPMGNVDTPRYYMQIVPFLLIIASCGIFYSASILKNIIGGRWILPVLVSIILGAYVINDVRNVIPFYSDQERVWLKTAEYLQNHAPENSIVMARKHHPAFYSGLRTSILPDEQNLNDVWEYAAFIGADYLVIDRHLTARLMPQYKDLLEDHLPPCLEIAQELFAGTDYQTRIFKFRKQNS